MREPGDRLLTVALALVAVVMVDEILNSLACLTRVLGATCLRGEAVNSPHYVVVCDSTGFIQ